MNLDIMKERYESLPIVELRAVAKARGMRGISALRKEDLIIRMLEEDKKEANQEEQEKTETAAARNGTDQLQEEKKEVRLLEARVSDFHPVYDEFQFPWIDGHKTGG